MSCIRTVLGDIKPEQLGICNPHEHLLAAPPEPYATHEPDLVMDSESAALQELTSFRQAGGRSIVEMTPIDYNRNPSGLAQLAAETGVHIVCVTGFLKEKFCGSWVEALSVDELTALFVREINDGIGETSIRAGVIKAASSLNVITPVEEKVFRAAAQASLQTGCLISTHTEAGTMALEQVALLTSIGVPSDRILIGHLDRNLEWKTIRQVAENGVFLGFDQISKEKYFPDSLRIEFVRKLIAEGFEDQILLASDLARRSNWPSYGSRGGPGLTYILWRFIPWLYSIGVPTDTLDKFVIHNPQRALSIKT